MFPVGGGQLLSESSLLGTGKPTPWGIGNLGRDHRDDDWVGIGHDRDPRGSRSVGVGPASNTVTQTALPTLFTTNYLRGRSNTREGVCRSRRAICPKANRAAPSRKRKSIQPNRHRGVLRGGSGSTCWSCSRTCSSCCLNRPAILKYCDERCARNPAGRAGG